MSYLANGNFFQKTNIYKQTVNTWCDVDGKITHTQSNPHKSIFPWTMPNDRRVRVKTTCFEDEYKKSWYDRTSILSE